MRRHGCLEGETIRKHGQLQLSFCQTNVTKPGNNDSLKSVELLVVHWWDPTFGMVGSKLHLSWHILIQKKYRKYISNKFENIWDTVIGINKIFRMTSYDIWIFAEVGYYESYYTYTTCKGLPPLAARSSGTRRVPENLGLVLVQFSVWCCTPDITLPFMGSGRASKGEASPQPEAHPCWRIGICSRKFRESSAKERAKVKVHFEGGWPSKSCKNNAQSATNCLENGFHDARWMLTRLSRSDPWWFGVIWQVMNESS